MIRTRRPGETPARALRWGALAVALLVGALVAHLQWRSQVSSDTEDRQWHESTSVSAPTTAPSLIGTADPPAVEHTGEPPSHRPGGSNQLAITVLSASEDAAPIPGAEVELLEASQLPGLDGVYLDSRKLASGRTGPSGHVDLEPRGRKPDQELLVQVRAPNWVGQLQSVGAGAETQREIEIKLQPGLALQGAVVTVSGDAVPGVVVSARRLGWPRRTTGRLPDDLGHWICKTKTDGRGAFAFDGLEDAYYEIAVDDPKWVHSIRPRAPGQPLEQALTTFRAGTADRILLEVERLLYYRARFVDSATGDGIPTADEVMVSGLIPSSAYRNVEPAELAGRGKSITLGPQGRDPALWVGAVALSSSDTAELASLAFTVPGYTYGATHVHLYDPTEVAGTVAVDEVRLDSQSGDFGSLLVTAHLPSGVTLPDVPPALAVFLRNGIVMFAGGTETTAGAWLYTRIPVTAAEVGLRDCHWIRYSVEVKRNAQSNVVMDFTSTPGFVVLLEAEGGERLFDAEVFLVESDTNFSIRVPSPVAALALGASGEPGRVPFFVDPGHYRLEAWLRGYRKAESEVTVPVDGLTSVSLTLEREQ